MIFLDILSPLGRLLNVTKSLLNLRWLKTEFGFRNPNSVLVGRYYLLRDSIAGSICFTILSRVSGPRGVPAKLVIATKDAVIPR